MLVYGVLTIGIPQRLSYLLVASFYTKWIWEPTRYIFNRPRLSLIDLPPHMHLLL
jgi:hypothetical protein